MKKLYFFVCLTSLFSLVSHAGIVVSHGDEVIVSGQEVLMDCSVEESTSGKSYVWDANLFISSNAGDIQATVQMQSDFNGFSICWPMFCQDVFPGEPTVVTGTVTSYSRDMQIHANLLADDLPDFDLAAPSAKISIMGGDEVLDFTVVCATPDDAGISGVSASDEDIQAVFNSAGIRCDHFSDGLNIVVFNNGKIKKIMK